MITIFTDKILMNNNIKVYPEPAILAEHFAEIFFNKISSLISYKERINIALSGGSTPKLFFKILSEYYAQKIKWEHIHLYWGDERCVPPDHPESNYGMTKKTLLDFISIPESNIHRIKGEDDPQKEAERYSKEILTFIESKNNLPSFDIVLLGLGEDGHTASIFPDQMHLLKSDKICDIAVHPDTKQKRITITGNILNNSYIVVFLVTGKSKADIMSKIFANDEQSNMFPVKHISSLSGNTEWYLDEDAATYISKSNI